MSRDDYLTGQMPQLADVLGLAEALIRRPSITPEDAGVQDLLAQRLVARGFRVERLRFGAPPHGPVDNLLASIGSGGPHFCFAGHTDVVPPGPRERWSVDPFAATLESGRLIGRGAADMKGAIAAFIIAAEQFLDAHGGPLPGTISLLITGDEEGPAQYGTDPTLAWMEQHGVRPDVCLVGEPTSAHRLGDTVKIGRRGSLNADIVVHGVQGHVAYPDRADNPITRLVRVLSALKERSLDTGSALFDASNLEITTVDVGNPTENLIPASASARLNIRFNDRQHSRDLVAWLGLQLRQHAPNHDLAVRVSGESFITDGGDLPAIVAAAISAHTGLTPAFSTSGGTSDARFIRRMCPVVEFGLPGATMHKADEQVRIDDLVTLVDIYRTVLERYFAGALAA